QPAAFSETHLLPQPARMQSKRVGICLRPIIHAPCGISQQNPLASKNIFRKLQGLPQTNDGSTGAWPYAQGRKCDLRFFFLIREQRSWLQAHEQRCAPNPPAASRRPPLRKGVKEARYARGSASGLG